MTDRGAERAITISALIVAGIYIYRRMTEGSGKPSGSKVAQLAGQGSPPPVGVFITGWGMAFLVISIVAAGAPALGGSFAILVATADALANATQVANDVNTKLKGRAATVKPTASGPAPVPPGFSTLSPNPPTPLPKGP